MNLFVCPTCHTAVNLEDRCPAEYGLGRCMEPVGHDGYHWTDLGRGDGSVTMFFGPFAKRTCPGRLDLRRWCVKEPGHEGWHNDGHGKSFSDPVKECVACDGKGRVQRPLPPPDSTRAYDVVYAIEECLVCHGTGEVG